VVIILAAYQFVGNCFGRCFCTLKSCRSVAPSAHDNDFDDDDSNDGDDDDDDDDDDAKVMMHDNSREDFEFSAQAGHDTIDVLDHTEPEISPECTVFDDHVD
jgi:hypothetical protein